MNNDKQLEFLYENIMNNSSNLDFKKIIDQLKMFYEFLSEGNYHTASRMYDEMDNTLIRMIPDEIITHMDTVNSQKT